jgi:hypothetical protein
MDAKTIERWIKSIGRPYDALVAEGVIPNQPLTELYKGRDWLTVKPGNGLELSFWAENRCLETFHIVLLKTMEGMTEYKGELPKPFVPVMAQSGVRTTFGEPMESKGPTKLPLNTMIGGWDAYRLDPATHPNTKLIFTYAETMQVKTLTFTLIDTGHD